MLFSNSPDSAPLFADVILPLNMPRPLTYGVPLELHDFVRPGMRVEVPLKGNKLYGGIVSRLHHDKPEAYDVKPIRAVIDEEPIISVTQLTFWEWVGGYYMAAPGEVMQAALPAHLKMSGETTVVWAGVEKSATWSEEAWTVAEALEIKKKLTLADFRALLGAKKWVEILQELLEAEAVWIQDNLETTYKPKKEKVVSLAPDYRGEQALIQLFKSLARAPKQVALLQAYLAYEQRGVPVRQRALLDTAALAPAVLRTMTEKGIFSIEEQTVDRLPCKPEPGNDAPIQLTPAQEAAYIAVRAAQERHAVVLLQGVTGSGKTLLYIERIRECLREGRQALLMLPEIGLTTQLVNRLYAYFGNELGVYHSRFSNNERVEIWEKVRSGRYAVVVGPRSALWLPFGSLGLIIVDEEHDPAYKQKDPAPRFHARDAAIYLGSRYSCPVILGSATPSVESLYNVEQGKYGLVQLTERYQGFPMPTIQLVRSVAGRASKNGRRPLISPELSAAIEGTLKRGNQVILFQNRRGYTPFQLCLVCGWVPQCNQCAVALTYHKSDDMLLCHYCGGRSAIVYTCLSCGSSQLQSKSFGTERVEEEIQALFPPARVARMDVDSMRAKESLPKLLDDLEHGRVDVLVGTQMVVKGLDFARVTLVGILSADSLLSYPDFRVNERAFQLMEQVAGRAGRSDAPGTVLIQTLNPHHPVLSWVQTHDVQAFYRHEIQYRHFFGYPPFSRMIKIVLKHEDERKAIEAATTMSIGLQQIDQLQVQGPVSALVARVRGLYVQEVWLRCPKDAALLRAAKQAAWQLKQSIAAQKGNGKLQILFDVDPV